MSLPEPLPYAIIIPARDEEPCIAQVLAELRAVVGPDVPIVVGVNGSRDRTAEVARASGALAAETPHAGYGYGCQAAVDLLDLKHAVTSYVFFAGDGADDPRDIAKLLEAHRRGARMVLGCRTQTPTNWNLMNLHYVIANRLLGMICGLLTGRFFADLGPLRLIERDLFHALHLQEWTFGWTIEAQIRGAMLRERIVEVPVRYRARIAGEQKVSHVSTLQTIRVGLKIIAAAFRSRLRPREL
jgi:glycosyltransferase involved in cell wall biosynthesis